MNNHEGPIFLSRRRVLRVLGAGAAASAIRPQLILCASPQPAATRRIAVPPSAIIRTILADVDPNAIAGRTLMHEHLGPFGRPQSGATPTRPTHDLDWMVDELKATAGHGVACIIAAQTSLPRPETTEYLKQLAERTGLHIVPTGSFYMGSAYPPDVATKSEDQIADDFVRAAAAGRFGAFGEIGVSNDEEDLSQAERKVFHAVGKAHVRTGVPIFTHNNYSTGARVPMDMALRQLDAFESVGVPPSRLALGHLCCLADPKATMAQQVAKRGAFVAFDRLTRQQQWMTDDQRVTMILAMLSAGYADHLLFSSDYSGMIVTSVGEHEFRTGPFSAHEGGPGWARSIVWFLPLLEKAGVDQETLKRITIDNPRRFLAFTPRTI